GPTMVVRCVSRTGFSREEAGGYTLDFCGVTHGAFPAKAGPTMVVRCVSGTGFSREEAGGYTLHFAV
ncbi:hypothetical protein, partial [Pseudomonas sp.]|uniref:hypothetical protein n=1 Tax=Pseudomonas sp. TaxID=306 RepID=UPI0025FAA4E6